MNTRESVETTKLQVACLGVCKALLAIIITRSIDVGDGMRERERERERERQRRGRSDQRRCCFTCPNPNLLTTKTERCARSSTAWRLACVVWTAVTCHEHECARVGKFSTNKTSGESPHRPAAVYCLNCPNWILLRAAISPYYMKSARLVPIACPSITVQSRLHLSELV